MLTSTRKEEGMPVLRRRSWPPGPSPYAGSAGAPPAARGRGHGARRPWHGGPMARFEWLKCRCQLLLVEAKALERAPRFSTSKPNVVQS